MDGGSRRSSMSITQRRKMSDFNGGLDGARRSSISLSSPRSQTISGERTVKRLRLSKALTIPENTTIQEACRRMAARKVDAVLLTDSNGLLCGILTDKDISRRVIACEVKIEETLVSKVMTRSPVFVLSESLAIEALQKMVLGKFRHLPVVENGEVIALLDIAKCLYDAIARLERAAEKGKAIAAAVEGVEKQWGTSISGPNTFIEALREQMFRPAVSTILPENLKSVVLSPSDSVLTATKKMLECKRSSAVVTVDNKLKGILTSKDVLMRLIVQNLPPESTPVEQVMTPDPECVTVDTPIVDALHTMHDGRFLHLPVVDKDGNFVAIIDVIHIAHVAVSTVGSSGGTGVESTTSMMQKFWDTALAEPLENDDDSKSEESLKLATETDAGRSSVLGSNSAFGFKIMDRMGRNHRFNCETQHLTDLLACILQRVGNDIDKNNLPQIMYEDEDHDKVVLASDSDLVAAVDHARLIGWKSLRLYLEYPDSKNDRRPKKSASALDYKHMDTSSSAYSSVAAGAALFAGLGLMAYLKRSNT